MRLPAILLLVLAGQLFAQLESNTITIAASRVLTAQPDQVVVNVTVDSPPAKGLDEVIAAVQSSGIAAANLSSVDTLSDGTLEWIFRQPVSLAKVQSTLATLTALQQTISKSNSGVTLSFFVEGLQVSEALAQSQLCSFADLVSDARSQAKKMADAAGFSVGAILAIDGSSGVAADVATFQVVRSLLTFATGVFYGTAPAPSPSCAITVKFQLLRYQ